MIGNGRALANFVLDECQREGRPITNLALQKIVYFCHVWSLVKLRQPLVKQRFEAWQFGPVLQYLYRDFKEFERKPITTRSKGLDPITGELQVVPYHFDIKVTQLLQQVVRVYSKLSPGSLVDLAHVTDGPWQRVWCHDGDVNPGMTITDESILDFYACRQPAFC
ncbi:Panacea domain-containing protein [Rhodanobacter ginsenosidimutans]|uniref:Panacea domain-containing protein n=1 Tax=Rhodanobacter ginsenosidimutans TaxID=490571 RepID=A0ABW0K037_9GAMM